MILDCLVPLLNHLVVGFQGCVFLHQVFSLLDQKLALVSVKLDLLALLIQLFADRSWRPAPLFNGCANYLLLVWVVHWVFALVILHVVDCALEPVSNELAQWPHVIYHDLAGFALFALRQVLEYQKSIHEFQHYVLPAGKEKLDLVIEPHLNFQIFHVLVVVADDFLEPGNLLVLLDQVLFKPDCLYLQNLFVFFFDGFFQRLHLFFLLLHFDSQVRDRVLLFADLRVDDFFRGFLRIAV